MFLKIILVASLLLNAISMFAMGDKDKEQLQGVLAVWGILILIGWFGYFIIDKLILG